MARITDEHRLAYYRGTLRGLRYLEGRKNTDRRFGKEADGRWASFGGDLTASDRIDMLLRDADIEWPGAFRPRCVFPLTGSAEDDPFGPEWEPLSPVVASELWREETSRNLPDGLGAAMTATLDCWGLQTEALAVPHVTPTDRFAVAGPSAVVALASAFDATSGVEWSDQVLCIADIPAHRQLAAQAGAFLGASRGTRLIVSLDEVASAGGKWRCLDSHDATASEREIIETIKAGGLV